MTTISDAVTFFRRRWATRFVDTVTVTRVTGRGTFNDTTYQYDADSSSTVFTGPALIRPFTADGTPAQFGQQQVTGKMYSVMVPWNVTDDFQPEDLVTVDVSAGDPDLVGKTLHVVSQSHDSYLTRIELICRYEEGSGYVD